MGGGAELVLVFIIPNNASSHQSPALDTVDTVDILEQKLASPPPSWVASVEVEELHHQTAVRGMMSC